MFSLWLIALTLVNANFDSTKMSLEPEWSQSIRFAGGRPGSVYNDIAQYVAAAGEERSLQFRATTTAGSYDNVNRLHEGQVEFAIAQADAIIKHAWHHTSPNYAAIRPLFTEYLHILVKTPLDLTSIEDIVGMRVYMGEYLSGSAATSKTLLELHGVTSNKYTRLKSLDSRGVIHLVRADSLDVVMHVGPLNNRFVRELTDSLDCRFFSLSPSTRRRMEARDRGEGSGSLAIGFIPAGTYNNQRSTTRTLKSTSVLLTRKDISDSLSYLVDSLVTHAALNIAKTYEQGALELVHSTSILPSGIRKVYPGLFVGSGDNWTATFQITQILAFFVICLLMARIFRKRISRFFMNRRIMIVPVMLAALCLLCAFTIWGLERSINEHFETPFAALWSMILYITSGFENRVPDTPLGRALAATILVAGSVFLASLAGIFASAIIKSMMERKMPRKLRDHYVILNWDSRIPGIIEQIHAPVRGTSAKSVVVVISDDAQLNLENLRQRFGSGSAQDAFEDVYFHPGDPCGERCLLNANVQDARCIIVTADTKMGDAADEKSIRSLLALQAIAEEHNPGMHVVVEMLKVENSSTVESLARHFPGVVDLVAGGRVRTLLLAHAAVIPGLTQFYRDLLSFGEETNEFYLANIPDSADGLSFSEYAAKVLLNEVEQPMIPVGLLRVVGGKPYLVANPRAVDQGGSENPFSRLRAGDKLLVLTYDAPQPDELPN